MPLDDQRPRTVEDEKVLLVGLPVVHRQRLARPEHRDPEPELLEDRVAAEVREPAPAFRLVPPQLVRVHDEPAVALAHEAMLPQLYRRFGAVLAAHRRTPRAW